MTKKNNPNLLKKKAIDVSTIILITIMCLLIILLKYLNKTEKVKIKQKAPPYLT